MEENKTPNKSEKDIIKENMLILYKAYQDGKKNTVDEISYYKQIVLQSEKSPIMYGLQDIYPVNIKEPEKFYGNRILLYQNGTPIAMIDENSNIKFSNEYLEQMKSLNPSIYALLHSMNGKHYELPQIQEVSGKLPDINSKQEVEDFKLSKEELENAKQNEGLFSFRKQREKQIEQYTNEESKIKTNVAEAKPEIKQENMSVEPKTEKIGNPLDTSDILLQLKQMKEKMEEEIKNTSTLKEEKEDYKLENSENDINGKIDNNEDTNADAKLNENNNDNSEEKVNIKIGNNEENTNKEEQENANSKQEENISEEKNGTIDDANAIIENIDDPEIQKEFEEIKGKMQDLNDNPQVVSEDFNEMYAKLFGRAPIQEETENKEQEESTTGAVDIIKDNISVFEGQEEAKKPAYKFIGIVFKTYIILEID